MWLGVRGGSATHAHTHIHTSRTYIFVHTTLKKLSTERGILLGNAFNYSMSSNVHVTTIHNVYNHSQPQLLSKQINKIEENPKGEELEEKNRGDHASRCTSNLLTQYLAHVAPLTSLIDCHGNQFRSSCREDDCIG